MPMPPSERKLRASAAGLTSWANTEDRAARLAPAREAFASKFEDQIDPERKLPAAERAQRADAARRAHYKRMALKSAQVRRRRRELEADEAELAADRSQTDLGEAS